MNPIRRTLVAAALAAACIAPALAQAPTVAGEVVKVDKAGGRLTIKHGEIKHLDMPAMTMSFKAREPKLLDDLAPGDRIRFVAEKLGGQYMVTQVFKAPS